jgi:hypothetical protein
MFLAGCGTGPSPADLHTSRFDFDEQALLPVVDVFTWLGACLSNRQPAYRR